MTARHSLSIWAKLCLIAFGLTVGLGAAAVASAFISLSPKGTEFASLDEARRAMLTPEGSDSEKVSLRSIITPHPDDSIIYELRPGLSLEFEGVPVRTNSCGMRGPDRPVAKPWNTYRIAMLGDSFTFGWGVEESKIFPQVLEDNLNRAAAGKVSFEVLNFGVPGYSTSQEVAAFEQKGLQFEPDAAVVFFIENDFSLPFYIHDIENPGRILPATNFARLLRGAFEPRYNEHHDTMRGQHPNRALESLADLAAVRGMRLYLAINPKKNWKSLKNQLPILRKRADIVVMSLREPFMRSVGINEIDAKDLTLPTDPHPSAVKHKLLGDVMAPYLMEATL